VNGYNFTERVRKILAMAQEESGRLRHEYVGTEHLLLGLIREGEGVAAIRTSRRYYGARRSWLTLWRMSGPRHST
jgi:ATP-dependent Clp protease ATP-binding subunit ClpA